MKTVKTGIQIIGTCLFFLYVAGLVYYLFLAESYGRGAEDAYHYNLIPFREIRRYLTYWHVLGVRIVFINLAGNIIGFIPFGIWLPVLVRRVRKGWKIILLSLEISTLVEVAQLIFKVGSFDVDDMILNTLGGAVGYSIFCILYNFWKRKEQ